MTLQAFSAVLAGVYLGSHAFDSLTRWGLDRFGLASLVYLRDVIAFTAVGVAFYLALQPGRSITALLALFGLAVIGFVSGVYWGLPVGQILFGFKVWLPAVLAFALFSVGAQADLHRERLGLAIWGLVCFGVLLDVWVDLPWTGLEVRVGELQIVGNRAWDIAGIERLSGFSRASYDAAAWALCLATYLIMIRAAIWSRVAIWICTGAVIVLTTSRAPLMAWMAGSLGIVVSLLLSQRSGTISVFVPRMMCVGAFFLVFVGAFAGFVLTAPDLPSGSRANFAFSSLADRAFNVWPHAFGLLEPWQYIAGRGFGGIGAAQAIFEPFRSNPADNLFVFVAVTGGALFAVTLGAMILFVALRQRQQFPVTFGLAIVLLCGFASNIIESVPLCFALGALLAMGAARSGPEVGILETKEKESSAPTRYSVAKA